MLIDAVKQFMGAAGQFKEEEYNVRLTALYTGLQFEEMAEKMTSMGCHLYAHDLTIMADRFKAGAMDENVAKANRIEMLDADVDIAWVSIGASFAAGSDVRGASEEVIRSNMSKFVVAEDGTLMGIRDKNGKLVKPDDYSPPELSDYVCWM